MKSLILAMLTVAVLVSSCKKQNQADSKPEPSQQIFGQNAYLGLDEIYAPSVPDSRPPDYCIVGPSSCGSVSVRPLYTDLADAVISGTYASWLNNAANYASLLEDFPEYEKLINDCMNGDKVMVYYKEPQHSEAAILMGKQGATDIQHHEASIVFY